METKKPRRKGSSANRYTPQEKFMMATEVESKMSLGVSKRQAVKQVAGDYGASNKLVMQIIDADTKPILNSRELGNLKKALISKSYSTSFTAQAAVNDEKLRKSSFVQLMVGSKIALEMARLLEDRSTVNISHRGLIETISSDRQKIMDQLKKYGVEATEEDLAS